MASPGDVEFLEQVAETYEEVPINSMMVMTWVLVGKKIRREKMDEKPLFKWL